MSNISLQSEIETLEFQKQKLMHLISSTKSYTSCSKSQIKDLNESVSSLRSILSTVRNDFQSVLTNKVSN
jgi:hypothetical protein